MDRKTLDRIWRALDAARRAPVTGRDLEELARMCGRTMRSGSNHPMWVTEHFPHRPFPIGRHGGNPVQGHRVRKVVIEHLELDAAAWEEVVKKFEADEASEVE